MEKKDEKYKWFLIGLLSIILLTSVLLKAQNYKYQDTTKTDTSKTDTSHTGKKKLGFNDSNFNSIKNLNNTYAYTGINYDKNYFQDTSKTDTDTTKKDTLGYNNFDSKNAYTYNNNSGKNNSVSINNKISKFEIEAVADQTRNINKEVSLTDKQIHEVNNILRGYEAVTYKSKGNSEYLNEAANEAQENIDDISTEMQKKEWRNVKDKWLASVNKELNLSTMVNSTQL